MGECAGLSEELAGEESAGNADEDECAVCGEFRVGCRVGGIGGCLAELARPSGHGIGCGAAAGEERLSAGIGPGQSGRERWRR